MADYVILWPVDDNARITSKFGARSAPTAGASTYHKGVDISVKSGTPIQAANAGRIQTGYNSTSGNWVSVIGSDGLTTTYRHLSSILVKAGDIVAQGDKIALSGNTGITTGPHLHFETVIDGEYKDPLEVRKMTKAAPAAAPAAAAPAAPAAPAKVDITLDDIQNDLEGVIDDITAAWPVALAVLAAVGLIRRR